jgi:hypothetical protein
MAIGAGAGAGAGASGSGGAGAGSVLGWVVNLMPQAVQNFRLLDSALQAGQIVGAASSVRHCLQNFAPGELSVWQEGHFIGILQSGALI